MFTEKGVQREIQRHVHRDIWVQRHGHRDRETERQGDMFTETDWHTDTKSDRHRDIDT